MKEGSIVAMTRDMKMKFRIAFKQVTGVEPPKPGDTPYMVTAIESRGEILRQMELALERKVKLAIYIDSYPKYYELLMPFDAAWFTELLPPKLDINQLLKADVCKKDPL